MYELCKKLSALSEEILQKEFSEKVAVHFSLSFIAGRGDLTTSVALQLAKRLEKSPQEIGMVLSEGLRTIDGVEKAEVIGGYVNVFLSAVALCSGLEEAKRASEPQPKKAQQDPVIIEYSQPNIAKPLGIHHILSTVIGQVVSNLYEHEGYPMIRWNYIGDWGTQFGKLSVALAKWGNGKSVSEYSIDELLAFYVRFHEEVEKDPTLEDQARHNFVMLEKGDANLRKFWEDVVGVTKKSLSSLYDRLHVAFDLDLGESFYEDKMDSLLAEGKKKGVFVQGQDGALIVLFPEETNLPPYLVQKGDGGTLYSTRDIAQMRYRMDTYHPQSILIFTDIAQKLHFEQLVATCKQLQWELPPFENVLFGRMRFADKSMSTRKGNILKLQDVLDEAVRRAEVLIEQRGDNIQTDNPKALAEMMGVGSVVYGVLSQNRKMDMVFDWDKMLTFEGNSAPYVQYTYARARSVLRKSGLEDCPLVLPASALSDHERLLIKMLSGYADVLASARTEHLPHKLCQYLYEVCQAYNSFYNTDDILSADSPVRAFRLGLTSLTSLVLHSGARLLTLSVPERM